MNAVGAAQHAMQAANRQRKPLIMALSAGIKAYEQAMWQDIETAPLGVEIIIATIGNEIPPIFDTLNEDSKAGLIDLSFTQRRIGAICWRYKPEEPGRIKALRPSRAKVSA